MNVRSATPPLPPVILRWIIFDSFFEPFDFTSVPDLCTQLTALYITVASRGIDQYRALTAISCCPNLRTLDLSPLQSDPPDHSSPPWPTELYLPHLRQLRIDPRLPAPFLALLLSNCSNIEHLVIQCSSQLPESVLNPVLFRQPITTLHRFPDLRKLDVIGGSISLDWFDRTINLKQSHELRRVYAIISLDDPLTKFGDTPVSCKLAVAVVPPPTNFQYALNPTLLRPH